MSTRSRRLLWGCYDGDGALAATFRVAEDRSLADVADNVSALPEALTVGVVHPLELDDAAREAWSGVFSDHEVVQPFAQLGREVFRLAPAERGAARLERFDGVAVSATQILALEHRGWRRDNYDGFEPTVRAYEMPVGPAARVVLSLSPGFQPREARESERQALASLQLSSREGPAPHWGSLDPLLVSEVLRDLEALRA